jgi:D-glycero-D-manno-heptose 1,7-bisphosphate phosphatase
VVLITNQRGISLGVMSGEDLRLIHEMMQRTLAERTGHRFDAIYFCPHGNGDDCDCRKPRPGMILRGLREHRIEPSSSWMIGDSESDVEAGAAAGCRTVKIDPQMGASSADIVVESLGEAWRSIVRLDSSVA